MKIYLVLLKTYNCNNQLDINSGYVEKFQMNSDWYQTFVKGINVYVFVGQVKQ